MLRHCKTGLVFLLATTLAIDPVWAGRLFGHRGGGCSSYCAPVTCCTPCVSYCSPCEGGAVAIPPKGSDVMRPTLADPETGTGRPSLNGDVSPSDRDNSTTRPIVPGPDPAPVPPTRDPVADPPPPKVDPAPPRTDPPPPRVDPKPPATDPDDPFGNPTPKPATPDPKPATRDLKPATPDPKPAVDPDDPFGGPTIDPAPKPKADPKPAELPDPAPDPKPAPTPTPTPTPPSTDDDPFGAPAPKADPKPATPETKPAKPADDDNPFGQISPPRPMVATFRTWTDDTGEWQVKGQLDKVLEGKVRLLKENGRFSTVPLERLSDADRQYVERYVASHGGEIGRTAAK